jgi:uncharacterized protein YgiM (DUF1202 family)
MNFKKNRWSILGFTTLSALAFAVFPKTARANQPISSQNPNQYQIAQVTNCREVDVNTALNVRQQPGGRVIGTLEDEQNVMIMGEPNNGWVRISNPMNGYVFASYLNYCTAAATPSQPMSQGMPMMQGMPTTPTTPNAWGGERVSTVPGSNCREVISANLPVRTKPEGEVIGTLEKNQMVYIANEGANGWVPIERPVSGYVNAENLGYCR